MAAATRRVLKRSEFVGGKAWILLKAAVCAVRFATVLSASPLRPAVVTPRRHRDLRLAGSICSVARKMARTPNRMGAGDRNGAAFSEEQPDLGTRCDADAGARGT
jgi:hypothetical protein